MAFVHGKKAFFGIDASVGAGSVTAIDGFLTDVSLSRNFEMATTTTISNDDNTYLVGLGDATISCSGYFDSTLDGYLNAHLADTATSIAFEFRTSDGSASSSNPKFTGECFITSYEISPPVGDTIPISIEFQVTGAVARATS